VTPAEAQALADVRGYAAAGRWTLLGHARRRAQERGARPEDVRRALVSATRCCAAEFGRWKVTGLDTAGDELTAVVELVDGVVVVTLF
jgi:hypothetical protein